ncbi:hypothetical protein [Amycolatopsis sp. H20-H5]|uniref:hypothetical protein n=1 Tax=Amycolatopsis sp. H20-H5 TaxID=3046309 RepID=UPI002DBE06AA|nr:hypothetical protein [Amycolatopsis sp. H20-H5]MEC3977224.1 hypothetical protein [Amycolatopsis sp. H20-H5]
MANQDEVNRANLSGRVHPSQRFAVLGWDFWPSLVIVLACSWVVGYAYKRAQDINMLSEHNEFIKPVSVFDDLLYLIPVLLPIAWFLRVCIRRIVEVSRGRLDVIGGRTHDVGDRRKTPVLPQCPLVLYTTYSRGNNPYYHLQAGGKSHAVDRDMHAKIKPEGNNTAFVTPITKRLINVAPSP